MQNQDRYWDCLDQAVAASSGGRVDEAMAWLDEALRANPKGAEAHNGRGELFWDTGRFEEALQEFDQAVGVGTVPPGAAWFERWSQSIGPDW